MYNIQLQQLQVSKIHSCIKQYIYATFPGYERTNSQRGSKQLYNRYKITLELTLDWYQSPCLCAWFQRRWNRTTLHPSTPRSNEHLPTPPQCAANHHNPSTNPSTSSSLSACCSSSPTRCKSGGIGCCCQWQPPIPVAWLLALLPTMSIVLLRGWIWGHRQATGKTWHLEEDQPRCRGTDNRGGRDLKGPSQWYPNRLWSSVCQAPQSSRLVERRCWWHLWWRCNCLD